MKAIILAAGRGSRMGGLTQDQPKCLTELRGRALLDWQINSLQAAGITEIGIVSGYRGELLERAGITRFVNPRWEQTNMVSSLTLAADWLRSDTCLVSYGDIVYPPTAVTALIQAHGPLLITYDRDWLSLWRARFDDPLNDAESFQLDAAGQLFDIGRRGVSLDQIQGQYMGLLRFEPAGWHQVEAQLASLEPFSRDKLDMTSLLRQLLQNGIQIGTQAISGGWLEVDSQSDLQAAEQLSASWPAYAWMRA